MNETKRDFTIVALVRKGDCTSRNFRVGVFPADISVKNFKPVGVVGLQDGE